MESNVVWDSVLAWDDSSIFDFSVSQAPDSDSISFNIDTSIVNHWISADSANPNTGLIFDYSGDAQFARQFLSSEMPPVDSLKRPQLILYITPFDSVDSVLWQADTTDTIRLYATNDVFIAVDTAQLANNRLYLGRAVAYRSLFRYDFSQIFPLFGVYINKAEFILFVDSENPLNVGEYSTVKFGRMNDTLWIADAQQADYTDITYLSSTISGDSITLNITPLVRSWVAEPDTNFGLAVHFTSEVSEMARAPLFTPQDPDSSKRPYLHIIYSEGVEP
jgi:hypothetical protein